MSGIVPKVILPKGLENTFDSDDFNTAYEYTHQQFKNDFEELLLN